MAIRGVEKSASCPAAPATQAASASMGRSWAPTRRRCSTASQTISELVHGQRPITADTALRLGLFFGMEPRFWLNLQSRATPSLCRSAAFRLSMKGRALAQPAQQGGQQFVGESVLKPGEAGHEGVDLLGRHRVSGQARCPLRGHRLREQAAVGCLRDSLLHVRPHVRGRARARVRR